MSERVDHTTGNIWSEDENGRMVLIGNVMDDKSTMTAEKVSTSMSNKEGLMQSCCNTYNNVHPFSWRDNDGKWSLAWRCEVCQRAMNLTINAKSSFPYITNGTPIVIPKDAIVVEHDKPDLQKIRALEMGVEVYRAEREKAVPSNITLFEGACPNCAYQPLTGKATADHSTVYKCTTCGLVHKVLATGEYCRYFGTTDLDIVEAPAEEDISVEDIPTDVASVEEVDTVTVVQPTLTDATVATESVDTADTTVSVNIPTSTVTETTYHVEQKDVLRPTKAIVLTSMNVGEDEIRNLIMAEDAPKSMCGATSVLTHIDEGGWITNPVDPFIPTTTQTPTEGNDMTQTTGMVHPTKTPVAEFTTDVFQAPAPAASPSIDDLDLSAVATASLEHDPTVGSIRVTDLGDAKTPQIASESPTSKAVSKVTASDIINTGIASVTEIHVAIDQSNGDSPVVMTKENTVRVYGHETEVGFVYNHVPSADSLHLYTVHPDYNNEPATFMTVHTKAVVPNGPDQNISGFRTFIQVHPGIKVSLKTQTLAYLSPSV